MEPRKTIEKLVSREYLCGTHLYLLLLAIMVMINSSPSEAATNLGNETDQLALLEFKSQIADGILSTWNESRPHCQWQGVTCGHKHQRVTALDLSSKDLSGSISPHIGNLSFLKYIDLGDNRLHGEIPHEIGRLFRLKHLDLTQNTLVGEIPHEIGRLFRLKHLNLTQNTLRGEIPMNLSNCTELEILAMARNEHSGELPLVLGTLKKLVRLSLHYNDFRGEIPHSFGNLSSLVIFSIAYNDLQGSIPNELSKLRKLSHFSVSANNMSGIIPPSLYNMSSLHVFSPAVNQFTGSLPSDIGSTLPNLVLFFVDGNLLTGTIPTSLANASLLQKVDLGQNYFTGQVPNNLGSLSGLQYFSVWGNQLGGNPHQDLSFLVPLSNCSKLTLLVLAENNLTGKFSESMANLSINMNYIDMYGNQIYGPIPNALGSLTNLYTLWMSNNDLTGTIPSSFGNLQSLQRLLLYQNQLSGQILSSFGNFSQLGDLDLSDNRLQGIIPESIGNCKNLRYLDLSNNNLSGLIPSQVISIPSLTISLNLSHNSLSGPLPAQVGKLINLISLDVSSNNLSGTIPTSIGDCSGLEYLNLSGNSFQGNITSTLASLKSIKQLDMSQNNLSGKIPKELESLKYLQYLNLSFNNLEGEIPTGGVFGNISAISIYGNNKLCGGILKLEKPSCPTTQVKKKQNIILIATLVCVSFFFIAVTSITVLYMRKKKIQLSNSSPSTEKIMRISYWELYKATNGFSPENSIGSGSFGSVYKGKLDNREDKIIAVKVLNLQNCRASKSFVAECMILRSVRHRNLVKLLTYCSTIDSNRDEFKALVYEFMPNGNLDMWLHPNAASRSRTLSLFQRLDIAIDIASALEYLHSHCEAPIVHCDLKPSNILLDDDMCAHVGDFGLARFRPESTSGTLEVSSIGIKGTVGYAAPEYGTGSEVSSFGDIYSYGIILLELLTGRRPTDDIFKDGLNLHIYVKEAHLKQVSQIMDPYLDRDKQVAAIEEEEGENYDEIVETGEYRESIGQSSHEGLKLKKSIVSILTIALACSEESPAQRMDINNVTRELHRVRSSILLGPCFMVIYKCFIVY